jgi:TonB family protein
MSQQVAEGKTDCQPGTQTPLSSSTDFEVKIVPEGFLVRQKRSQEWKLSGGLNEPIAVGVLDGNQKIYVMTKAIKRPKGKHLPDPDYPPGHSNGGQISLHMVVDDQGTVRLPTVDVSPGPEFSQAAIEAVKKWTFKPATLNGQPVAVLIKAEFVFH